MAATDRVVLSFTEKDPGETVRLGVDFETLLATGETISSAAVSIRTLRGDSDPSAMLSGSPAIDGTAITELVSGGTDGDTYLLAFEATTDAGQIIIESAKLVVRNID